MIQSTEKHIVPQIPFPVRIQEYGVGIFNSAPTKSALKKVLKRNLVTINGIVATSATFVHGGECIVLAIKVEMTVEKQLLFPLKVLYEDEHLALIHKPAGILVSGNAYRTIANALVQNLQKSSCFDVTQPQPVHRLDYVTTGILLVGKTKSSIRALNALFENQKVEKIYYAVTIGEMESCGTMDKDVDCKSAYTTYNLVKSVDSKRFGRLNLIQLQPHTGRRHQLRKHLFGIGNPILGDKEYAISDLVLNGKGLYLHAYALRFIHPFTNEELYIKDEITVKFRNIFNTELPHNYI